MRQKAELKNANFTCTEKSILHLSYLYITTTYYVILAYVNTFQEVFNSWIIFYYWIEFQSLEDFYNRARFKRFTIKSYTRGSLYYTFIWHILFSEIYHQILYTWFSILYIYLTLYCFQRFTIRSNTRGSLYYTFIWHMYFRDLPSHPIHVVLYIMHLFDTYCFQRFTIRSYTMDLYESST